MSTERGATIRRRPPEIVSEVPPAAVEAQEAAPRTEAAPAAPRFEPRPPTDFEGLRQIAEMDQAEVYRMLEQFSGGPRGPTLKRGQRLRGKISRLSATTAFVNVGTKMDASIDRHELDANAAVGDEIEAFITTNPQEGEIRLTRILGGDAAAEMLEAAKDAGSSVEGTITGHNDHGFEVQLGGGFRAFCPMSQIGRPPITDPGSYVGQSLQFKILEVRGREAIVSHRSIAEAEAAADLERQLGLVAKDEVYQGVVTSIRDFGVFVRLPTGIEGLVHVSNLSKQRLNHPSEAGLKEGQDVTVRVLGVDVERRRLTLGIKQVGEQASTGPSQGGGPSGRPERAPEQKFGLLAGLLSDWKPAEKVRKKR